MGNYPVVCFGIILSLGIRGTPYRTVTQSPRNKSVGSIASASDIGHFLCLDAFPFNPKQISVAQIGVYQRYLG